MTKSVFTIEYQSFIDLLKRSRQEKLTQKELADKLKKPQSYISKYEQKERRLDVIETLIILKALEIEPVKFFRELEKILAKIDRF